MSVVKSIAAVILDYTNFTTVFLAVFVLLLLQKLFKKPNNLPPGPPPWPLVGNLFTLSPDSLHLQYTEWARQYGPVFTIYFGPRPVVVLNSYNTIHDAFVNKADILSDRERNRISLGIVFAPYGPVWKEQRKFTMSGLRDFGFGKRSLEGKILEEAEALGKEIINTDGKPFNIFYLLRKAVTNVICSIVFGARHNFEDSAFKTFLQDMDIRIGTPLIIIILSPLLRHVPKLGKSSKMFYESKHRIHQFVEGKLEEHERDFAPNDIRSFADTYIKEIRSGQNKNFTKAQLVQIVVDLILVGTDTTSQTLYWMLLYMMIYPDVQKRVQKEINSTFGDSPPTTAKRTELPFTAATISEVQRMSSAAPITLQHRASNDTTIDGYAIPEGTTIQANLWYVLKDPNLWEQPDQFKPERFLDNQGQYMNKDAFIPFSIGRRSCLGAQLAKMELFMFTTYLLQHFTFKLPEGAPTPSTVGKFGQTLGPSPYQLCAIPKADQGRNESSII